MGIYWLNPQNLLNRRGLKWNAQEQEDIETEIMTRPSSCGLIVSPYRCPPSLSVQPKYCHKPRNMAPGDSQTPATRRK